MTNLEKIATLLIRAKKGNKTGLLYVDEKPAAEGIALHIEMIDGKKYGVMIKELSKGNEDD